MSASIAVAKVPPHSAEPVSTVLIKTMSWWGNCITEASDFCGFEEIYGDHRKKWSWAVCVRMNKKIRSEYSEAFILARNQLFWRETNYFGEKPIKEEPMQQRLEAAYQKFKEQAQIPEELSKRLSSPLLIQISKTWIDSNHRILVIGQETLGWAFHKDEDYPWPYEAILNFSDFKTVEASVEALVHGYREFEFALHQPSNYRSPFWQAYRQIYSEHL
jgi:hypothetical protein